MDTLDSLKKEIAGAGAAATAATETMPFTPAPASPLFDRAAEARAWAELPSAVGDLLAMALPELKDAYTPENCLRWGERMTAVAEKYNWTAQIVGPWVGLAVASIPLAVPTYIAIKVRRMTPEQRAGVEAAAKQAAEATRAAAARDVTPEKKPDTPPGPPKVAPVE